VASRSRLWTPKRSAPFRFEPCRCKVAGCDLPALDGRPIAVSYRTPLLVRQGRLVATGGQEMHAASFLRKRRLVLDGALRRDPAEWRRIVVHELFHFVWVRLGNSARRCWHELLRAEFAGHAKGELGWSAEWRKERLTADALRRPTRLAREYACESFCDTAAWLYAGAGRHPEFTLPARWRKPRRLWFIQQFGERAVPL